MSDELTTAESAGEPTMTKGTQYPVEFNGSGMEYFKIWIVNVVLTILTLTIYSAWASVRTRRYFYGNTVVDGSSFEYHATGKQIFIGRLIAIVVLVAVTVGGKFNPYVAIAAYILMALLIPWVIWRSFKFTARMSSYRNVHFGFFGTAKRIYVILLLFPILLLVVAGALIAGASVTENKQLIGIVSVALVLAFYAMYPIFHQMLAFYSHNFHRYGTSKFVAPLTKRRFIFIYLKTFFLSLLVLAIAGGIAYAVSQSIDLTAFDFESLAESKSAIVIAIGAYALFLLIGAIITAFFRARIRNYRYDSTTVGGRVKLRSSVRTWPLAWLSISNLLLLLITIGFAYPWVKVRTARFFARNTKIYSNGPLDNFTAGEKEKVSSLGDELGDAFDLDLDIGI